MWRAFITTYFDFTKKERIGFAVIAVLIICIAMSTYFSSYFIQHTNQDSAEFKKAIEALKLQSVDSSKQYRNKKYDQNSNQNFYQTAKNNADSKEQWKGELFNFDPNTLDEAGWRKLGIKEKTIGTIKNYLSKGGKFYKPADIFKIWGIKKEDAERLVPFIEIDATAFKKKYETTSFTNSNYEKRPYTAPVIDVNSADTTAFISLPGIGSKLSQRIITFREKLGGFYKIDQVGETFGLQDSTFQKIKSRLSIAKVEVKKLSINTSTMEELKAHPYIRYAIANAIVQYRTQHGNFTNLNDLKKIMTITDEIYVKALPYLSLN